MFWPEKTNTQTGLISPRGNRLHSSLHSASQALPLRLPRLRHLGSLVLLASLHPHLLLDNRQIWAHKSQRLASHRLLGNPLRSGPGLQNQRSDNPPSASLLLANRHLVSHQRRELQDLDNPVRDRRHSHKPHNPTRWHKAEQHLLARLLRLLHSARPLAKRLHHHLHRLAASRMHRQAEDSDNHQHSVAVGVDSGNLLNLRLRRLANPSSSRRRR